MRPDCLIIGYGDIGRRTADLLNGEGRQVVVAGRSVDPRREAAPLRAGVAVDLDRRESLEALPLDARCVLYLAPPPGSGHLDSRVRHLCDELTSRLPQLPGGIVYISTSGVYGDCNGERVDETRPVNPQTDRARRRVDAETVVQSWGEAHQVPVVILRVAGIYGPGRLPLQRLRDGIPVLQPDQAPASNRIHADDLARVCLAAIDRVGLQGVFNVCDGETSSMSDYFLSVARVFDLPEPDRIDRREAARVFSPEMLSYLGESRRLDNHRLLEELGVTLRYPDLETGLRAIRQQVAE